MVNFINCNHLQKYYSIYTKQEIILSPKTNINHCNVLVACLLYVIRSYHDTIYILSSTNIYKSKILLVSGQTKSKFN